MAKARNQPWFEITSVGQFMKLTDQQRWLALRFVPAVLILSTDGGSDHKNCYVQNVAALLAILIVLDAYTVVSFRNCANAWCWRLTKPPPLAPRVR